MDRKRLALSDELRRAVDDCPMSRYRICKELGIAESTLSRFMSGERGLTMKRLDRLADLLDLHVITVERRQKKGRRNDGKHQQ
jgi:transcriptional regulator with XRE-family HTH domain